MESIVVSDYLENYDKNTGKGSCIKCSKPIHWARDSVRGHKRKVCPYSTEEEKAFFQALTDQKKSGISIFQSSSSSNQSQVFGQSKNFSNFCLSSNIMLNTNNIAQVYTVK
jgi:hypothetical protein